MELIFYWYAGVALLVAIMSSIDLYHPVISKRELSLDSKILHYITLFLISLLITPLLIYPCLSSIKGVEFRDSLDKSLFG